MGVHGLWRLIEPSGKPVPLETLENKVLAVDVSIWLHQIIKGFQDKRGASVPNAHLLGIYHRVCKLLYFKIKPVFVFDGGVPALKRQTIILRNQQKLKTLSKADTIHRNLLSALVKHSAISKVLSEKAKAAITSATSPTKKKSSEDDLYALPPTQLDSTVSSEDEESSDSSQPHYDLHSIDTQSAEFKSLPVEMRHEILTDLKETRKQSSWGRIHELPTESNDFSGYQMKRLLKRQSVQSALEEVEKEMGGHSLSLADLEKLLKDQGVITNVKGSRIASDENTRFLLIKDIKQALEDARSKDLPAIEERDEEEAKEDSPEKIQNKGNEEFEDDLKKAIALSLEEAPSTSGTASEQPSTSSTVNKVGRKGKSRISLSFLADFEDADFGDSESSEEEEEFRVRLTPAQRYMMEYSGLTSHAIKKIITTNSATSKKDTVISNGAARDAPDSTKSEDDFQTKMKDFSNADAKRKVSVEENSDQSDIEFVDVEPTNKSMPVEFPEDDVHKIKQSRKNEDQEVQEMSDSSSGDDFVDVETKNEASAMEVVINPDEEVEDDLFKDVFETKEDKVSSVEDKVMEELVTSTIEESKTDRIATTQENLEEVKSAEEEQAIKTVEEPKTRDKTSDKSVKESIENMVKVYSKPKEAQSEKISLEQLKEMKENLAKEQKDLVAEKSSKERLAGNITDQMCQEAQELLELFGVPYLVAPMEAEAQCAFLDLVNLTDGTITDDSDIWLFGGRTVYKNFFDQNKIVYEYKAENIQQNFKLSREQMILLAMLVGSDYTTGLSGVGPVTALEILAAFPPKNHLISGLAEFKSWFKKGKIPGPGRNALKGKLKNVSISENFPNPRIVQAYLEPTVETSREKFSWGKPDVVGLVDFAKQKFGWTKVKSEEILNPILKKMEDRNFQKAITSYFKVETKVTSSEGAEKIMSKRVKTAVERIAKGPVSDKEEQEEKKTVKRGARKKKVEDSGAEQPPKKSARKNDGKTKRKKEDEELKILKETEERSKRRVEEIKEEVEKEIGQKKKTINLQRLHKKEVIPQKQRDKSDILRNKLKAIETFRKSKQGPGYVKKRGKVKRDTKEDASYLSEGSSSD